MKSRMFSIGTTMALFVVSQLILLLHNGFISRDIHVGRQLHSILDLNSKYIIKTERESNPSTWITGNLYSKVTMSSNQASIAGVDMLEVEDHDMMDPKEDPDYKSSSSYAPSSEEESDNEFKPKLHLAAKDTKKTPITASASAQSSNLVSARVSHIEAQNAAQPIAEDSNDEDFEPDGDEMDVYSEVSDEDDIQAAEEDLPPSQCHADFPERIIQLLEMIPLHHKHISNIRQLVIDFIQHEIDPVVLQIIANLLTLAENTVLRDLAQTVMSIVHNCANGPGLYSLGRFLHDQFVYADSQVQLFMQGLQSAQIQAAFSRTDWTAGRLNHFFRNHVAIRAQPSNSEVFGTLHINYCPNNPSWDYQPITRRTLEDVRRFLASLLIVPITSLGDDSCGICWKTYRELAPAEKAVKLPCGHVFSSGCLEKLLGPKPDGWERKLCPMCHGEITFPATTAA